MPTIIGSYQPVSYVNAPTITSPAAGGKFYGNAPLVVSVGNFGVTNGMDTQSKLTAMISTDINGNNVVLSKASSGEVNSVTFDAYDLNQNLTGNTTYYISAKYTGTYLGDSAKSSSVNLLFIAASGVVTQSSRNIYRHESDEGSVIKFDHFGVTWEVLWLDAKYRNSNAIVTTTGDTDNPNITKTGYVSNSNSEIAATDPIGIVTDATLQSRFSEWSADLVMQKLCDNFILSYPLNAPVIEYCRELQVPGFVHGFDVPDLYTLAVGFIEGITLDEFDPTAAANPSRAMSTLYNPSGHGRINNTDRTWSSTEYDRSFNMCIYWNSDANFSTKSSTGGVCPTRLIGITTPSGRRVYRHSSDQGSVIEFDWFGTPRKVLWLDAAYRTSAKLANSSTDTGNPNITKTGYVSNSGNSIAATDPIGIVTDATLQSRFSSWANDLPMKTLCDNYITSYTLENVPAIKYCRELTVAGVTGPFDLPDIYAVAVAFIEGEYIDSLDPTAAANPTKAMSTLYNTSGHGYMDSKAAIWSSTEYNSNHGMYVVYNSYAYNGNKDYVGGVCPAQEVTA